MSLRVVFITLAALVGSCAIVYLDASPVLAQCSMCRTALEQNAEAAEGFNRAILFLLAAPYAVFATIAGSWLWRLRQPASAKATGGWPASAKATARWRTEWSPQPDASDRIGPGTDLSR